MFKFLIALSFLFSVNLLAATQTMEVIIKKTDLVQVDPNVKIKTLDIFTLNGMRQALTKELEDKKLSSEDFWQKLDAKKMSDTEEMEFLKPFFQSTSLAIPEVQALDTREKNKADLFERAFFTYEIDSSNVLKLYDNFQINLPDAAIKTFYILPEISIDFDMTWEDVGVSKKENFSGVIIESWKKWAQTQFKNFQSVVVLEKDLSTRPLNLNPESVTLKWNSNLKRAEVFQDRKTARFELTAQFVLINTKSGESLVGFDFPGQKREASISNPKDLSSNLASLIFNLLNSQTSKITTALELNKTSGTFNTVEMSIIGKHGLLDISQLNSLLIEKFKEVALSSELKKYSSEASVISIKSTANLEALTALFARDGGRFPLNEQKILLFNPASRTFAIIPK